MEQEPLRFQRQVREHKRKVPNTNRQVRVRDYAQGYISPRGRIRSVKPDSLTRFSQTMWLKDRYGHFIGRANYEGKSTARNIMSYGLDDTTSIRDTKRYKRVFGRVPTESRRRRRYSR